MSVYTNESAMSVYTNHTQTGTKAHVDAYYPVYNLLRNRADLFDADTGRSVTSKTPLKSRTLHPDTVAFFKAHTADELRALGFRVRKPHSSRDALIAKYAANWSEG